MHDNSAMCPRQDSSLARQTEPASIGDWLRMGAGRLRESSDSPRLDCEVLLAHALNVNRTALHARSPEILDPGQAGHFEELLGRRAQGRPVAQIVGRKEFFSLDFEVTPEVLTPRPETELLVDRIRRELAAHRAETHCLELGTGCGAVAIALARLSPQARITATDIAAASLAIARRNAGRLAPARIRFLEGSWYAPVDPGLRFEAIACNPPYVETGLLDRPPLSFEPRVALDGGPEGLAALREVIAGAPCRLKPGGALGVEHGHLHGAAVRKLMEEAGLAEAATHRDLAGRERVTLARKPE